MSTRRAAALPPNTMTNQEIARVLIHISEILSIQGENPFKIRAYVRAAQTLEGLTYELSAVEDPEEIGKLPGIGAGIAKKVAELLEHGRSEYYEGLKESEYAPLTEFLKIPGMGPKHSRLVYDELGIKTVEALRKAAEEGRLRGLHGLGAKAEQTILQGILQSQKYKERLPLAFVYPKAAAILEDLRGQKGIKNAVLAGSLRRMRDTVADVDILTASKDAAPVMDAFVRLPQAEKVLAKGETKSSIITKDGFQADLRVVQPESFGAACHYFTGSKAHNIRIRSLGLEKGLKINEYGVFRKETRIAGKTEKEVFEAVDLPYIPPELREDQGEIEAARDRRLPGLIELKDLRGDLHVHSDWTDGHNTIEEMARAAGERGYRYLAICDHSPAVAVTHGLGPERVLRQKEEIEGLNRQWKDFRVLSGIEVDIRSDGRLDLEEGILKRLDIVVASVHSGLGQPEAEITRRIVKAIENPHVDIIAHPTGRLIGRREPYPVDMDRIMDACKANGTILELNAYPERLDLSDLNCRRAKEKGVKIAISTDAHRIGHLEWMYFGIATARRGWLEPRDVVNTLPLNKLLKLLKS